MTAVSRCKKCDAPITWAKTKNGNNQPFDAIAAAAFSGKAWWRLVDVGDTKQAVFVPEEDRRFYEGELHVPHHATCPNAKDFAGGHQ